MPDASILLLVATFIALCVLTYIRCTNAIMWLPVTWCLLQPSFLKVIPNINARCLIIAFSCYVYCSVSFDLHQMYKCNNVVACATLRFLHSSFLKVIKSQPSLSLPPHILILGHKVLVVTFIVVYVLTYIRYTNATMWFPVLLSICDLLLSKRPPPPLPPPPHSTPNFHFRAQHQCQMPPLCFCVYVYCGMCFALYNLIFKCKLWMSVLGTLGIN